MKQGSGEEGGRWGGRKGEREVSRGTRAAPGGRIKKVASGEGRAGRAVVVSSVSGDVYCEMRLRDSGFRFYWVQSRF